MKTTRRRTLVFATLMRFLYVILDFNFIMVVVRLGDLRARIPHSFYVIEIS